MAKYSKSIEIKAIESNLANEIAQAVDWHYFNPAVVANIISTDMPLYTQGRIMELVKWIIKYEARRFQVEWEKGNTTEGLMMADLLNDVLEAKYGKDDSLEKVLAEAPELDLTKEAYHIQLNDKSVTINHAFF
ncbi:MAG: hypothetical protein ACO3CQ_08125 [Candidatus Nanopelagicaceae bacterium]